jgi:hypothetical protein
LTLLQVCCSSLGTGCLLLMRPLAVQRFSTDPSKLIIGIDLATTRCCLATGQRLLDDDYSHAAPDVKLYCCWTDSYEAGSKWPITAILYNSRRIPKTGNDLEMAFKSPMSRNFDMDKHFRQWKLLFHDDQSDPTVKKIRDGLSQKLVSLGMTRIELLRDWVKLIYAELLIRHKDGLYSLKESFGRFDKTDIEIVVTVPPGRSVWIFPAPRSITPSQCSTTLRASVE